MNKSAGGVVVLVVALLLTGVVLSLTLGPDGDSNLPQRTDAAPSEVPDPTQAGEDLPDGFRQLLGRDDIYPVYEPEFLGAEDVDWDDDTLVIGLEIDGDARAYPVDYLNWREMVIDNVGGIPVLVSW